MPRKHLEEVLSKMERNEKIAANIQIVLCAITAIFSIILTVSILC